MTQTVAVVDTVKYDAQIAHEVLGDVAEVRTIDATTVDGVVAAAGDADALIPWHIPLDADVLDRFESLEIIGVAGTGIGHVDLAAAAEREITVVNAPTYAVEEVSTHAMALLLACVRSLPAYDAAVREGVWDRGPGEPIRRLRGRTLGLLAFGNIARRTAEKAQAFGLDVVAYDPYVDAETFAAAGVTPVSFGDLLAGADLFSLHAPTTSDTTGLLDDDAFAAMRNGVILVNTGRGGVVREAALVDALEDGTVARAGLDVFESEPLVDSPLTDRDDVILSPHVAWYSEDSRAEVIRSVATDIRRVITGEAPTGGVRPDTEWA